MEENMRRHLSEKFGEAVMKFGMYHNGMCGDLYSLLWYLECRVRKDKLEYLALHQGVEFLFQSGDVCVLKDDVRLNGCTEYEFMGKKMLRGFTWNKRDRVPEVISAGLGDRWTNMQSYYPTANQVREDFKRGNVDISLGAIYGMREGNAMLQKIQNAAEDAITNYSK